MFADSIVESAWAHTSRRGWSALASFTVQGLLLGLVLLLPLIYTQGLPELKLMAGLTPVIAPPAGPPKVPTGDRVIRTTDSNIARTGILVAPERVPDHVADNIHDVAPPDPVGYSGTQVPGGVGDPRLQRLVDGPIGGTGGALPPPPPKPAARPVIKTSVIMEGYLVHRVQPSYPPLARAARIQGLVELHAIIGKDGLIENLRVLGGHPMLVAAAVEAVRQWRYRPYILNGEPVEVETQITVNFVLSGS